MYGLIRYNWGTRKYFFCTSVLAPYRVTVYFKKKTHHAFVLMHINKYSLLSILHIALNNTPKPPYKSMSLTLALSV